MRKLNIRSIPYTIHYKHIFWLLTAYFFLFTTTLSAQANLVQISDNVYQFLDRMTIKGVINSNEFSKPLSRREIAEYLSKIYEKNSELNKVEKEELDWYLHEYTNETASLYSLSPYPPIPFLSEFHCIGTSLYAQFARFPAPPGQFIESACRKRTQYRWKVVSSTRFRIQRSEFSSRTVTPLSPTFPARCARTISASSPAIRSPSSSHRMI